MTREIVLVEDEMVVGLEIRKTLERLGYDLAKVFTGGESAVDYVRENPVGLILMDVQLDGSLDGIETTRRVHEDTDIPVVFVTSYSDDETIDRMKSTEARGYIFKPFQKNDLDKAVSHVLDEGTNDPDLSNGALFLQWIGQLLSPGAGGVVDPAPSAG